jgi:ribosomal protein S18 acetylase RimI-like enzyme
VAASAIREARAGRDDDLLELVHALRKDLEQRGERLPPGWMEEAVADLRSGRITGWYAPPGTGRGELGFFSQRGGRHFGHVHVLAGPDPVARAAALLGRLGADPRTRSLPLNLGVTGLSSAEEDALGRIWNETPGRSVTLREGLERSLSGTGLEAPDPIPLGMAHFPIRSITEAALTDLDWRGFRGSEDAALFAVDRIENDRMVAGILGGNLGPFLDGASTALVTEPNELSGTLLTVEISPRVGLFADLVVDPGRRRHGLGRYLVRWGLRALLALGYESARLWVTEGNQPARQLYGRLEFRVYARAHIFRQEGVGAAPQPQTAR